MKVSKNNHGLMLTIVFCVALVALQIAAMLVPVAIFPMFNLFVRPLVFALLAVMVFAIMGRDERPIPNSYTVNLMAVFAVGLMSMTFLIFTFIFGLVINPMASNLVVIGNNLWSFGSVVLLGEYIRVKLIKSTNMQTQTEVVIGLTLVLAFAYMSGVRALITSGITVESFFVSIFTPLVISAGASYLAVKGGLLSVVLVSFPSVMAGHLLPILPDITPLAFALVISGCLYASLFTCHLVIKDRSPEIQNREKRLARYTSKPVLGAFLTTSVIAISIAFFLGAFTLYPMVILTSSMEPTMTRGSLTFVERIDSEEIFEKVGEGYVIHFVCPGGVEYIHRVVGHWYDHRGVRYYITQGDAGEAQDPFPIPQENVLGIARASLPFLGYPYLFFQGIQGSLN